MNTSANYPERQVDLMNIGFIGAGGNMARALIHCANNSVLKNGGKLYLSSRTLEKLSDYEKNGAVICKSNADVVLNCDYIFLCVKPQILPSVLDEIKVVAAHDKCFVCIAAGVSIDSIKFALGFDAKVIRAMPNTPLLVSAGASALCTNSPVTDDDFSLVKSVFDFGGAAVSVDESQMDAVTAVSGSGPAYFYRFIKNIAKSGEALGLTYDDSLKLALSTALGSCKMIGEYANSDADLQQLIDNVTSPNGTTYAALCSFDETGFDKSVCDALTACYNRSKELGSGK